MFLKGNVSFKKTRFYKQIKIYALTCILNNPVYLYDKYLCQTVIFSNTRGT